MAEAPIRKEPPPFRPVTVARTEQRSPTLMRVTLTGDALDGFDVGLPAASVRLLLPDDAGTVDIPTWNGNEFLAADGSRPRIRTLTPLRFDPSALELDVEVVLHDDSPLTAWAQGATEGTAAAVSGTGRGYEVDERVEAYVLVGDEAALPAITTVLPALPTTATVQVIVEVRHAHSRIELPAPEQATISWEELPPAGRPGDAMVEAATKLDYPADVRVWAAGEAAAVQRIRKHLFDEVGLPRRHATVRGYWKVGRAEGGT
jgi:NADPH-dependent ferric siderophore reductase